MSNVKLAIRVRPFSERELKSEKDRVPVVNVVDSNTVTITNIKVSISGAGDSRERIRQYYADYTFDSFCPGTHPSYASQEKVFESIGREVISSVSRGCSACVLAYGQSATGKTHTMMGSDAQPGLVPRLCKALYELQPFDFTISFLEIYNERVHDLLSGEVPLPPCHSLPRRRGNARKDLRVREHPSRGPYVQNLRRVSVQDVEALLSLVAEGTRRRRTAATRRNSTSSRSHALLEITTPHATLHLADLAGSEKASWEGCGGGRQKEGANINKSLVALSNVISALVNGGSTRGKFVPYRDSALTWLLKDCFTGGASTFIIATVSPSVVCYGESASTLRWAARARQLPTPRTVSCESHVATRAALQAQLNQLISELSRNHIRYVPETGKILFDEEHWAPRVNQNDSQHEDLNKVAIIGNIMNITRLKPDATNSESTASSVASGSSDVINTVDKNSTIASEINKEMDKLFGPALERASSGDDLKVIAPLRHKKRQFRSQEVLANDDISTISQSSNLVTTLPSQSEASINEAPSTDKTKVPHITILHDNQRAEIVASVTERLYTKLKKKEEAAVSKVESMVDRKIMEPLSELKICTNARQRLMELSQKAIRNKRRIGIPAHTQTRHTVTRVRDQAVDVQTDLYSYISRNGHPYAFCRDVATETVHMTPRCKEIAVGPTGSLHSCDVSTETKIVTYKNSNVMTDIVNQNERCTQTIIVPPPRRRKRSSTSKHVCCKENRNFSEECISAPVISINISQMYPVDTESQTSDDNSEKLKVAHSKSSVVTSTPDLLTNHSTIDPQNVIDIKEDEICVLVNVAEERKVPVIIQEDDDIKSIDPVKHNEEFPDTEDFALPRVSPNPARTVNSSEIKNMILGRNQNIYPYNIILSPPKERDSKRIVTFKDNHAGKTNDTASETRNVDETNGDINKNESASDMTTSDKEFPLEKDYESLYSDSTESSKVDTDSFIWKQGSSRTMGCLKKNYIPVYKSSKYKTTKARVFKDFLGLESEGHQLGLNSYETRENIRDVSSSDSRDTDNGSEYKSRRRKPYSENKSYYNRGRDYNDDVNEYQSIERKLINSCNNLEESVNRYENYVSNYKEGMKIDGVESTTRRPKEYLQHLVQLRREVVKAESDNTDSSSMDVSNK
ncbi:kinesin heavy chain-like [Spodoptera litura]|uniref:Kinesin heavy chain-like n=1 Tax=Spodoptera litura TaxID=69820 RepID=A0A9J7INC8_SPOLT|nr:kinesin heavy chain-like [Spodoptera litura]